MAFSDLHIETTKRLAAQRQIDAAVSHLLKSELECAITLANGAEGLLPETESRQIFAYLREHPLSGLHSFLSMSLIEARRRNASAFRLRFSQSLARRLHRPSHANVRSTTHRFGRTTNPFA